MNSDEVFCFHKAPLNDTDRSIIETVSKWADKEVIAARLEHAEDERNFLGSAMRHLLVDIGLQSLFTPNTEDESKDASDITQFTLASVLEQVGRADLGIAFLLANTFALQRAVPKGDFPSAKEPMLGSLILPDYSDANTSANVEGLACQVAAIKDKDTYLLSGEKVRPQCSGVDASFFGVICDLESESVLFLAPGDSKGLVRGEFFLKTGLAASCNADLRFDRVSLPGKSLIFRGRKQIVNLLNDYGLACAAASVGALLATWEILKDWAETRVIKGKGMIFKDNPLTGTMLGDIGSRIGLCRMLLYDQARLLNAPDQHGGDEGAVRIMTAGITQWVLRTSVEIVNNAMELMASAGYATEWNLERIWRDLKTLESNLGPPAATKAMMARHYFGSNIE